MSVAEQKKEATFDSQCQDRKAGIGCVKGGSYVRSRGLVSGTALCKDPNDALLSTTLFRREQRPLAHFSRLSLSRPSILASKSAFEGTRHDLFRHEDVEATCIRYHIHFQDISAIISIKPLLILQSRHARNHFISNHKPHVEKSEDILPDAQSMS